MNSIFKSILAAVIFIPSMAFAQGECSIDVSVADITKGEVVPESVNQRLQAKLSQAISKAGLVSAPYESRFFVAGRFDDAYNDITGGPPRRCMSRLP